MSSIELILIGFLMGVVIALAISLILDSQRERKDYEWVLQIDDALTNTDFCSVGCGYYEYCMNHYKDDKDLAMDELYHNYCYNCPVKMATELVNQKK